MNTFVEKIALGAAELDRKKKVLKWFLASLTGYTIKGEKARDSSTSEELRFKSSTGVSWSVSISYNGIVQGACFARIDCFAPSNGCVYTAGENLPMVDIYPVYGSLNELSIKLQERFPTLKEFFDLLVSQADEAHQQQAQSV